MSAKVRSYTLLFKFTGVKILILPLVAGLIASATLTISALFELASPQMTEFW